MTITALETTPCPSCKLPVRRGLQFCGECGANVVSGEARVLDTEPDAGRRFPPLIVAGAVLLLASLLLSFLAFRSQRGLAQSERAAWQKAVGAISAEVDSIAKQLSAVSGKSKTLATELDKASKGIAPLASKTLKSVFRVESDNGFGAGFAAWKANRGLFVLTAYHVVERNVGATVTLTRKGGSWSGDIVGTDKANDLAVIRVSAKPEGATPLWQHARKQRPKPGDQLLLIGSPYGLDGTVTTGIVSRVTRKWIQTDAAANPGNSGGPAVDKQGRIVGVLVAGGGQNLNFVVPIGLVCKKLRNC
jgi:S1-C subfamily serine protease